MPQRGLDSLDNSFEKIIGKPSNFGINYNFDPLDKLSSRGYMLETPRSGMNKDSAYSPTNNQLANLYKVTNKTTTIKETKP